MTKSTSFDAFASAVSEAYPRLPRTLQQIAQVVLEKPDELALGTVATVAEAAGVQPSALIRFANTFGFAGFTEMQQLFRSRLLDRVGSYRDRINTMRQSDTRVGQDGVLHQFVASGMSDLASLEDHVGAAQMAEAAKLIGGARRVHVLAQRRAFPVAAYLAYALGQLELKVQLLDGVGGMLNDAVRQIDPGELLLVVSFKNYSRDVVAAAESVHGAGIDVLAITDFALSPLKPHATLSFELGQGPDTAFRSLVAPLCLAQALVVGTGHHLANGRHKGKARAQPAASKPGTRPSAKRQPT